MNDIKTIEEPRAYHERLKSVLTALQRLEEGTNQRIKLHSSKSTTPMVWFKVDNKRILNGALV
jgi:hypothetical protein